MAAHDDTPVFPTEPQVAGSERDAHQLEPLSAGAIDGLLGLALDSGYAAGRWELPTVAEMQTALPLYEFAGLIGRGGMGAVYRARQRRLGRWVAIKILPPAMGECHAHFAARFEREARALAHLTHPGIVAVYDAGQTSEGLLYFVMEFVEGTDVQQLLATQGRLAAEDALAVAMHVCDALDYAHRHGVILSRYQALECAAG